VPVWYLVAKDEGHGFQKKSNTDYQRAVLFEFMRRYLLGEKANGDTKMEGGVNRISRVENCESVQIKRIDIGKTKRK